jgi:hypothetical protein
MLRRIKGGVGNFSPDTRASPAVRIGPAPSTFTGKPRITARPALGDDQERAEIRTHPRVGGIAPKPVMTSPAAKSTKEELMMSTIFRRIVIGFALALFAAQGLAAEKAASHRIVIQVRCADHLSWRTA